MMEESTADSMSHHFTVKTNTGISAAHTLARLHEAYNAI